MPKFFNPSGVAAPQAGYHHGVLVKPNAETLYTAGQLGIKPDGTLAQGIKEQATWALKNLVSVLEEVGMGPQNLVKIRHFLMAQEYLQIIEETCVEVLGDAKPASTLVVVKSLALPEFLFEVDGVAVREV